MRNRLSSMLAVVLLSVPSGCAAPGRGAAGAGGATTDMSFFLTSAGPGDGANLGGLAGADAHCQTLAAAAGAGGRTWRAYLSTSAASGQAAVNARDRIGAGPWYNARGVRVASNVAELHGEGSALGKAWSLTERGDTVNGRGDTPNRHDILTGSQPDGTAFPDTADRTCRNWTSGADGSAQVGHQTGKAAASGRPRGTRRTRRGGAARRTCARRAGTACSTASPAERRRLERAGHPARLGDWQKGRCCAVGLRS